MTLQRLAPLGVRLGLVLLAILAAASLFLGTGRALAPDGSIDFGIILKTAQLLLHENVYQLYFTSPKQVGEVLRPDLNPYPMIPVQVPSVLMLIWPLAPLPWPTAKLVWLLLNLGATAGLLILGFRRFLPARAGMVHFAAIALLVASQPWRIVVANGQTTIVALFFFVLALELADRKHALWAGLALAMSFAKYTLTLFLLPYFVLKRQWIPLVAALLLHALLTVAAAVRLNENPLDLLRQSIAASSELAGSGFVDLFAVASGLGLSSAIAAALSACLVLAAGWIAVRKASTDGDWFLACLCCLATILVYHRIYDLVVLLISLLVVWRRWDEHRMAAAMFLVSLMLLWLTYGLVEPVAPAQGISATRWLVALCWYATIGAMLAGLFRRQRATETAAPTSKEGTG